MQSRPRGAVRAARVCWRGSPAARRCGGRCRSPHARSPRGDGSWSSCGTRASATSLRRSSRPRADRLGADHPRIGPLRGPGWVAERGERRSGKGGGWTGGERRAERYPGGMLGLGTIAGVAKELRRDVAAARDRDPAARGVGPAEIVATWPGIHALLSHRIAHAMYEAGVPLAPRTLAMFTRALTGIEIHPAARIGEGLFIEHGAGVVGGEAATIGNDVTLYQGVTLGGTGFAAGKRHPTVQDNVTIGS